MKKYLLIVITMAVALAFSSYAGSNIFIANTPQVNPNYLANLQSQFKKNVNNVYLAFSFKAKKTNIKKDIAVVYPTVAPRINGKVNLVKKNIAAVPTLVPRINSTTSKAKIVVVNPTTIPANLFKSISKGVSAYEGENQVVFKIEKGAKYNVRKIEINGKQYEVIDLTGQ